MNTSTAITYCRICGATCGLVVELDHSGAVPVIVKVSADEQNPLSRGFTCTKGRHIADIAQAPHRLRSSRRRNAAGEFEEVPVDQAIDEIAAQLLDIIDTHGPDSVAMFTGTQAAFASLTLPFALAWWRTMGSRQKYSSMSVDQVAKWVTEERMGMWAAGGQRLADSDVWMFWGTNPLVSMQGGYFTGFPIHDGLRRIQEEVDRGLRLIVIDPRRTEVATRAEVHLQLIPGTDATLAAGLLRQIITNGHVDTAFEQRWVDGLDVLRGAVEPFTPDLVAEVCGVDADDVMRAARIFGEASMGMSTAGTGPDMGPHANLAEHLIQTLNVVCGRYPHPCDPLANVAVLGSPKGLPAQVVPGGRSWESDVSPISGYGPLHGELPSVTLPDEILSDRPDRIRAMVVIGANPANAIPDTERMAEALSSLDLLVTIDPFESPTAQLADYVIAPVTDLERPDTTRAYEGLMDRPFAQYTPAILPAPPGVIDDWVFLLRLGHAMGRTIKVAGREYAPGDPVPTTDEVLASMAGRGQISLADVRDHPHGLMVDAAASPVATGPSPDSDGRFTVAPDDVVAELAELAAAAGPPDPDQLLLAVRRQKHVLNSLGTQIPSLLRRHANPCFVHPEVLARLGLASGDDVTVATAHGNVHATVLADESLRPGVLTLTHGFRGNGPDGLPTGPNLNSILSATTKLQPISGMPLLTAVPVTLTRRLDGIGGAHSSRPAIGTHG